MKGQNKFMDNEMFKSKIMVLKKERAGAAYGA